MKRWSWFHKAFFIACFLFLLIMLGATVVAQVRVSGMTGIDADEIQKLRKAG